MMCSVQKKIVSFVDSMSFNEKLIKEEKRREVKIDKVREIGRK